MTGCNSEKLCRRLLREADVQLAEAIGIARSLDTSHQQATAMTGQGPAEVAALRNRYAHKETIPRRTPEPQWAQETRASQRDASDAPRSISMHVPPGEAAVVTPARQREQDTTALTCFRCRHPGHKTCDAAKGKQRSRCGKFNHFVKACCKERPIPSMGNVHHRPPDHSARAARGRNLHLNPPAAKTEYYTVEISGFPHEVLLDSGASANIISKTALASCPPAEAHLEPQTLRLRQFTAERWRDAPASPHAQWARPPHNYTRSLRSMQHQHTAPTVDGHRAGLLHIGPSDAVANIRNQKVDIDETVQQHSQCSTGLGNYNLHFFEKIYMRKSIIINI